MSDDWDTPVTSTAVNGSIAFESSGANGLDNGTVLKDIHNVTEQTAEEAPFDPQAKGWCKPTKFDYDSYVSGPLVGAEGNSLRNNENRGFGGSSTTWAANAARYEWSDEFGEVAPRVPELEEELYSEKRNSKQGEKMNNLDFKVETESETSIEYIKKFDGAGLHPVMLENIALCKYREPTPIQAYTIPAILTGHDLIAIAQTGSGKTAAFMIPILSKLMGKAAKLAGPRPKPGANPSLRENMVVAEPLVLVVVPTRELAVQIFDEARRLSYRSMLRPCVAYGGGPVKDQLRELGRGCDILIGTPGRLKDFMGRGTVLSLRRVKYTVIDEADEMVGYDWQDDLRELLSGGDNNEDGDHHYLMFSATFPKAAQELAKEYLEDNHVRIKVGRPGSTHQNVFQHFIWAEKDRKKNCLRDLLKTCDPVRTIIFVNNKRVCDELDDFLYNNNYPSTSIHSDRTQLEREDALMGFRRGDSPILITTGVSARGLDVIEVGHVINYDLPKSDHGGIDEYVHRIGRTARIGNVGVSTSFYNDEEDEGLARRLVKLLIENEQAIPDFMERFKPEEGKDLNFDDDDEDEVTAGADGDGSAGGAGWGADEEATNGETNGVTHDLGIPETAAATADDDGW